MRQTFRPGRSAPRFRVRVPARRYNGTTKRFGMGSMPARHPSPSDIKPHQMRFRPAKGYGPTPRQKRARRLAAVTSICGAVAVGLVLCFGPLHLFSVLAEAAPGDESVPVAASAAPQSEDASASSGQPSTSAEASSSGGSESSAQEGSVMESTESAAAAQGGAQKSAPEQSAAAAAPTESAMAPVASPEASPMQKQSFWNRLWGKKEAEPEAATVSPDGEEVSVEMTDPEKRAQVSPSPTAAPTPTPTPDPTLSQGMTSDKVQELQERLMSLGYLDIDESTKFYGPATAYAVSMFQRQHELDQDGVAGPRTLDILFTDAARPYTLLEGTSGNDVDMLQSRLIELGYLGQATGYYGTDTVQAVKDFQARNGLVVDGKTGAATLDLIYSSDALPTEELMQQSVRQGTIANFLACAEAQLGKPYVWGAAGPDSFDCSGLVTYALRQAGSTTGRLNAAGFAANNDWEKITSMDAMETGDLIFYYNAKRSKVGHVGIYIGNGMMIDASSSNGKIVKRSCRDSYWESHFVCARRPW